MDTLTLVAILGAVAVLMAVGALYVRNRLRRHRGAAPGYPGGQGGSSSVHVNGKHVMTAEGGVGGQGGASGRDPQYERHLRNMRRLPWWPK